VNNEVIMSEMYPLIFHPFFVEKVWGGRRLETIYGKTLPPQVPVGESWEISDSPEIESIVANGTFAGKTLHWLMEHYHDELMGKACDINGRFPLLVKILDVHSNISVQVHPDKKEMWLVTYTEQDGQIYTGLKKGVTPQMFNTAVEQGNVESMLHSNSVKAEDAISIPPGGIHSVGAGVMLFEVQQNSGTTYRVYDWDRKETGESRPLHIEEALQCLDYGYEEPLLIQSKFSRNKILSSRFLFNDHAFVCDEYQLKRDQHFYINNIVPIIFGVVSGELTVSAGGETVCLKNGEFCLLPAGAGRTTIKAGTTTCYLMVQPQAEEN
jgi:mannose-6-phosphate isomerase